MATNADNGHEQVTSQSPKMPESALAKDAGSSALAREPETAVYNEEYQKRSWADLKKAIDHQVKKCNRNSIREVVVGLFRLNLHRGMGLLARSIMRAQLDDPKLTPIYASLVAVLNSKIPEIGELVGIRVLLLFKKSYVSNDKRITLSALQFLLHLVNQRVVDETLLLEILQLLLDKAPTNNCIEVSVEIMTTAGKLLTENSVMAANMVFDRLRGFIQQNEGISKRSQMLIDQLLKVRRAGFKDHPTIEKVLDLVEDADQNPHALELNGVYSSKDILNIYRFDSDYAKNEASYDEVRTDVIGDEDDDDEDEDDDEEAEEMVQIKDMTDSNLLNYQKTIYLTIMSSMSADEAVHKLLQLAKKRSLESGRADQNSVLVDMIIKCCSQEKTYSKFFGLIAEKLCSMNRQWHAIFVEHFKSYYNTIHQFESNHLRNIGKLFGHLFALDKLAIEESWNEIRLTEEDTTSASRIFIKFFFQEIIEEIGIKGLQEILDDDFIKVRITGLFPVRDVSWRDAEHIRFSINFFTAIGLGALTEEMRDVLKKLPPPEEQRGRSRSRSGSYSSRGSSCSRSRSGSYSRSRSGSYSRSRSRSFSRSRSASYSRSPSRSPQPTTEANARDTNRTSSQSRQDVARGSSPPRKKQRS